MRRCLIFSIVTFCFTFLQAQKESNIWYFGSNAGIDFNATPPIALTDGSMITTEGCATISDKNGRLLFYTNGRNVYSKTHHVMPNGDGLLGHTSSTQSAVIVPWPDTDSLYYIITSDAYENAGLFGYNYSVVNINKFGGLGQVIVKNQPLYSPSTEKIAIAKHSNEMDWWVITRQWGNNQFNVYLIDKNGFHTMPIVSQAGSVLNRPTMVGGSMTIAPNNLKLAVAYSDITGVDPFVEVYDFDNTSGSINRAIKIKEVYPYGLAFSPDSKLLYVSSMTVSNTSKVDQLDITTGTDSISLEATRITITPANYGMFPRGLQLGPDNKIYVNNYSQIAVINNPDNKGTLCNFEDNVIDLKGKVGGLMFPSIIKNKPVNFTIDAIITITDTCKREVQFQAISNQTTNVTYKWNFADGTYSTIQNPQKIFPFVVNGFLVQLEVSADVPTASGLQRQIRKFEKWIRFQLLPQANAGNDRAALAGAPFQLNGSGGVRYEWAPAQYLTDPFIANPTATLQQDQTFILKASNADGCADTDTVTIKVYKEAAIYVPTGFTPNADGNNDVLKVFTEGAKLESFTVFNRWGTALFTTNDPSKGWNGQYKGKQQPTGTYTWIVKGIGLNGQPIFKKGTVTLVR